MIEAPSELQRAQPWLGTLVSIQLTAASGVAVAQLQSLVDAAFEEVARVHRRMSYHTADSTLTRINREASSHPVQADPDTQTVLRAALKFAAESDGAFDPTVAGQLEDWGYLPRPARAAPSERGNWRHVELDDAGCVRLHRALRLDLGGIAKGYAVDRASELLAGAGVDSYLINAGGDLRAGGTCPRTICLRDPRAPASIAHRLELKQGALATSGSYYSARRLERREVSHLIDPRQATPLLTHELSVTVRAARCMDADALTKVVLFADPETAQTCLERHQAHAIVLRGASP